ncbi:homoserine O-succinyltransferase [Helicobacter marmotae]|uniref:Homoserine O-acetyltransferase n=1 Tax=Helicobacter marmotae TaxID=152490 RepID=A0A3D8I475_9HELI|nr:homoserine O-succinyltransferase [Helicobacter marmotae]RDU59554.1 homoserine O-succinyltransferase [Helicobacter marmotae]
MPLIIPRDIPAFELLKSHAFVIDTQRAQHQDIRTLEVLIINLMPIKIETENQILSLLANSPLQVNITLLSTASYVGSNTSKSHLERFYVNFSDILGRNFDGAIVTGAPVEHLAYEEVAYWEELKQIMDYLKAHCTSTLYLCWGAMAGLYHFHKIPKVALSAKAFGIFEHRIITQDSLLTGVDEIVKMPHSRHSGIDEKSVRASGLKILLEGEESGISALRDEKDYFILAHPEYAKDTLLLEYERDKQKGLDIAKPLYYFNERGEVVLSWKSSASVMFSNWLNFSVYQNTPFVL